MHFSLEINRSLVFPDLVILPYLFKYKSHFHILPDQMVQIFLNNIFSTKSCNKNLKAIKVIAFIVLK